MSKKQAPPHFIVIVPGYMGSKLRKRDTKEVIWVDTSSIPLNPFSWKSWLNNILTTLEYPNDGLEPSGIMDDVIFIPPWAKLENYERLIKKLQSLGYKADLAQCFGYEGDQPPFDESKLNVYAFAYDWRQDNRRSAKQLGEAINRWREYHPGAQVWMIAHSNGGVVARWYIEQEGGKDQVGRLFLMGSPWDGTPKALSMAFNGLDTLFSRRFDLFGIPEKTRKLVRTFPSIYQLIPYQNPFLRDAGNNHVNPFSDGVWVDQSQAQLLQDGLAFSQTLGTAMSVETICFFGTRRATPTSGRVIFEAANAWKEIQWDQQADAGDGTIPERSAVHPGAKEKLPYPVSHGDIYVDEAVLEKLRYEMIDKYRAAERDAVITNNLKIVFEQGSGSAGDTGTEHQDFYNPGQVINLWATVHKLPQDTSSGEESTDERAGEGSQPAADATTEPGENDLEPVTNASIRVNVIWRQALPGAKNPGESVELPPKNLPEIYLTKSRDIQGRYAGRLAAPETQGYYELQATVSVFNEPVVRLKELIAVEAEPDEALKEEIQKEG